MRRATRGGLVLASLVAVGCGAGCSGGEAPVAQSSPVAEAGTDGDSTPSPSESPPVVVTAAVTASPVLVTASYVTIPAAIIIGHLDVDGPCLYFAGDGGRQALMLPAGASWDGAAAELVVDGRRFRQGDAMRGGGGYVSVDTVAAEFPAAARQLQRCLPGTRSDEQSTVALFAIAM